MRNIRRFVFFSSIIKHLPILLLAEEIKKYRLGLAFFKKEETGLQAVSRVLRFYQKQNPPELKVNQHY